MILFTLLIYYPVTFLCTVIPLLPYPDSTQLIIDFCQILITLLPWLLQDLMFG